VLDALVVAGRFGESLRPQLELEYIERLLRDF
jgi:hypothetical protein